MVAHQDGATDTGPTSLTAGNKIVELDPMTELDSDAVDGAAVTTDDLSVMADILSEIGADDQSAQLEIERRHLAENDEHTMRFTAKGLTEIAMSLTVARTMAHYFGDQATMFRIEKFGALIEETDSAPMAAEYGDLEYPGMVPGEGQGDEIDPFQAIAGRQYLHFTDEEGDLVPMSEPERLTFYDEEPTDDSPEFETITPE